MFTEGPVGKIIGAPLAKLPTGLKQASRMSITHFFILVRRFLWVADAGTASLSLWSLMSSNVVVTFVMGLANPPEMVSIIISTEVMSNQ